MFGYSYPNMGINQSELAKESHYIITVIAIILKLMDQHISDKYSLNALDLPVLRTCQKRNEHILNSTLKSHLVT